MYLQNQIQSDDLPQVQFTRTKKVEADRELQAKIKELNEKNRQLQRYIDSNMELENFAYIASHDMKEPLRTVSSFADLLKKNYAETLDAVGLEYLNFIIQGARNMNQLIEDLLTYSRVTNEEHNVKEINLADKLLAIQYSISNFIEEKQAKLHYEDLPSDVVANPTKIKQVFQNLIVNAIKFHKPDETPEVHIFCTEQENHWLFEVRDNGIGINRAFHEKIFLLFHKLHTRNEFQGTGIGLALCKKIIEQHGGQIWVESEEGTGTSFFFTIEKLPTPIH